MNLAEAVAIDPQGYRTKTCIFCQEQVARRVFVGGAASGPWRHVKTNSNQCPAQQPKTPFLETEFLRAVMEDRADDAETILAGMMMGERYELDKTLARANKLVNLYRQAHDNL